MCSELHTISFGNEYFIYDLVFIGPPLNLVRKYYILRSKRFWEFQENGEKLKIYGHDI